MKNITTTKCLMSEVMEIFPNIVVHGGKFIILGSKVSFNGFCHLSAHKDGPIIIGNNVIIGPYVIMNSGDHIYSDMSKLIRNQGHVYSPIRIGNDVWIGAGAIILRGSIIPDGCVIGAGSMVTRRIKMEPFGVYVGTPAVKIKSRT